MKITDVQFQDMIPFDKSYTENLLSIINTIIQTNYSKCSFFDEDNLKIIVEYSSDKLFAARCTYEEETIYVASWLFYLKKSDTDITIFNQKENVLLEEITHFVDNKIGFSSDKEFLNIMREERIENSDNKIEKLFQFVYFLSFSFSNDARFYTRNWQAMIRTCNMTALFNLPRIKRFFKSFSDYNNIYKYNIPTKSSHPVLAKEYLFDLILARKALESYFKNPQCLEKLYKLDEMYKFENQPTYTINSLIKELNLEKYQTADEALKSIVPKSYNYLIDFNNKFK